jgi:uncharacterized membrane protein
MTIAITLHVLSAALWVGGMFFAYMALRPAAAQLLEPPQRLPLWVASFKRFFPWVWLFVTVLPVTGYWMIFVPFGGMTSVGLHVHLMQGLGWVMILMFMHLYFAPFRRLKEAVIIADWPEAGRRLNQIRFIVGTNLLLGILVIAIGAGGRYW